MSLWPDCSCRQMKVKCSFPCHSQEGPIRIVSPKSPPDARQRRCRPWAPCRQAIASCVDKASLAAAPLRAYHPPMVNSWLCFAVAMFLVGCGAPSSTLAPPTTSDPTPPAPAASPPASTVASAPVAAEPSAVAPAPAAATAGRDEWSDLRPISFPPEGTSTRIVVDACKDGVLARRRKPFRILVQPRGITVDADIRYNCADEVTFSHASVQGHRLNIIVHTPRSPGPRARCMCESTVRVAARTGPGKYTVSFSQKGGSLDFQRDVVVPATGD